MPIVNLGLGVDSVAMLIGLAARALGGDGDLVAITRAPQLRLWAA